MKLPHLLIALFLSTSFLCSTPLASGQDLRDRNYATVGRIDSDGTVRDRNYATVGHINSDGTVRDRNYATVGHIDNDGTVRDRNYATMGYAKGVPQKWAAVFFFFDLP